MAEAEIKKASKTAQDYSMQYVFLRKHQNCKEIQSEKPCTEFPEKLHSYSSKWSAGSTPLPFIKCKVNFTRAATKHVCSMLLLMQNINPLTGVNVVQLESCTGISFGTKLLSLEKMVLKDCFVPEWK